MTQHIPNILTLSRVAAIPLIVALLLSANATLMLAAGILFVLAALTDYLDGYSARYFNVVSNFGKSFDPIADKLLVLSMLMMLTYLGKAAVIPAIIILCREVVISGMREYLGTNNGSSIPVSRVAKYKTTFQLIALTLLLIFNQPQILLLGNLTLWIAAILALISAYNYIKGAMSQLTATS